MTCRTLKVTFRELAIVIALLAILGLLALPLLTRAREAASRPSCQNNLKQLGIVFKMFANESNGHYPALSRVYNNWMFDVNALYPDYLSDFSVLVCPSSPLADLEPFNLRGSSEVHPACVSSLFYVYTGYVLLSDEQALALFDEYQRNPDAVISQQTLTLNVPEWEGSGRVIGAAQADIPIVWDRVFVDPDAFSHQPLGANVLHMDGHVEFVHYSYYNNSSFFPVTRISAETCCPQCRQNAFRCCDF